MSLFNFCHSLDYKSVCNTYYWLGETLQIQSTFRGKYFQIIKHREYFIHLKCMKAGCMSTQTCIGKPLNPPTKLPSCISYNKKIAGLSLPCLLPVSLQCSSLQLGYFYLRETMVTLSVQVDQPATMAVYSISFYSTIPRDMAMIHYIIRCRIEQSMD